MRFTLDLPGIGPADYWAEDGSSLRQILAEIDLSASQVTWNQGLDQVVSQGALIQSQDSSDPALVEPAPGGWRLVQLGGNQSGREISLRAVGAPVKAGQTRRGRVLLAPWPVANDPGAGSSLLAAPWLARRWRDSERPGPGGPPGRRGLTGPPGSQTRPESQTRPGPGRRPGSHRPPGAEATWLGTVRRPRSGHLAVRWRKLNRPRWAGARTLLRTAEGDIFSLLRAPIAGASSEPVSGPRRSWKTVGSAAATGLVMAVVMLVISRNPMWAALPLAGVLAAAIPLLARPPKVPWTSGVIGLDPDCDGSLGALTALEVIGPAEIAAALARRLVAESTSQVGQVSRTSRASPSMTGIHGNPTDPAGPVGQANWSGPLPPLIVPPGPDWAWARFAHRPTGARTALTITTTDSGLLIETGPDGIGQNVSPTNATWRRDQTGPPVVGPPAQLTPARRRQTGPPPPGQASPPNQDWRRTGLVRLVVRDAGLGLITARGLGGEALTALGLAGPVLEGELRPLPGGSGTAPLPEFPTSAEQIEQAWRRRKLPPIGYSAAGQPAILDLTKDGPHVLVAGTSGSGKSEFLRALMLAEALTTPPDRLTIVGLDHKGGATFRDLERLPHVAGVATDLDAADTSRVLSSLEAELANRERLLERQAAAAWQDLPETDRPARLLVVVDEFRTLLDSSPEASARLERLAAQGRSLGMGLVLATQRPAGAVSAQLRANLALRICFRVASESDSLDVLGTPDAAQIDPASPGSCVVATAGRPLAAWRVSLMPPPRRRPAQPASWPEQWSEPVRPTAGLDDLISAVQRAARARRAKPRPAPWLPPLSPVIKTAALAASRPGSITLGLADLPSGQTQTEAAWDPASGHLAILGAPRSGRTQAAVTAAAGLTAAGTVTHVITHQPAAFRVLAGQDALGALIDARQVERIEQLLAGLGQADCALVVDTAADLDGLTVSSLGLGLIDAVTGGGLAPGASLVITGPPKVSRWLAMCPNRLILPVAQTSDDLMLGVPRDMAHARHLPGRACYLSAAGAVTSQVGLTSGSPGGPSCQLICPPPRVLPLPGRVGPDDLPPDRPGGPVWIGLGGPYGTPLALPVPEGRPVAVMGPHGSGRSAALNHIYQRLEATGRSPRRIPTEPAPTWPDLVAELNDGGVVVVDDAESVEGPPPTRLPRRGTLIAACTTAAAASFRPPATLFQAHPLGILLWPAAPGSAAAFGPGRAGGTAVDLAGPRPPDPPGRGRLILPGRSYPVQLAAA